MQEAVVAGDDGKEAGAFASHRAEEVKASQRARSVSKKQVNMSSGTYSGHVQIYLRGLG